MTILSFLVASSQYHIGKLRWRAYCCTFRVYEETRYLREHELPVSSKPLCHMRLVRNSLRLPVSQVRWVRPSYFQTPSKLLVLSS